jgi:hypothetical protein
MAAEAAPPTSVITSPAWESTRPWEAPYSRSAHTPAATTSTRGMRVACTRAAASDFVTAAHSPGLISR